MKNIFSRLSIAFKIASLIYVLFLVVLIGASIYININISNFVEKESLKTASRFSSFFQDTLKQFMLAGDAEVVRSWIEKERKTIGLEIEVYRRNGDVAFLDNHTIRQVNAFLGGTNFPLHKTERHDVATKEIKDLVLQVSQTGEPVSVHRKENGKDIFIYLSPIQRDNRCLGCHGYEDEHIRGVSKITIPFRLVNATDLEALQKRNTLFGFALFTFSFFFFAWLIKYNLQKPVRKLAQAAQEYGKGNLKGEIPKEFGREFNPVIDEFNNMSGKLQAMYANLEELVEKRTADLNQANIELKARDEEIKEDIEKAMLVQMEMLPPPEMQFRHLKFSSFYIPCSDLSGDFYGYFRLSRDQYIFYLADVSGHGISSSLATILINELITQEVQRFEEQQFPLSLCYNPGKFIASLNNQIQKKLTGSHFCTMFMGMIDAKAMTLTYAGAAHPPAFLYKSKKKQVEKLESQGTIVGFYQDEAFPDSTISLQKGDKLVLFTDGIFEVEGEQGSTMSLEHLENALLEKVSEVSGVPLILELYNVAITYSTSGHLADDTAFLLVEMTPDAEASEK